MTGEASRNLVKAPDLEINGAADGYIVYQPDRDRVHYLNQTVLELCNGRNAEADLPELLRLDGICRSRRSKRCAMPVPPTQSPPRCCESLKTSSFELGSERPGASLPSRIGDRPDMPNPSNIVRSRNDAEHRYPAATLVSFASRGFRQQQAHLSQSAINVGIDCVILWNNERLARENFFHAHRDIFEHKIGFGCWLWKPFIIAHELSRLLDDEFLLYWDVGHAIYPHRFELSPKPLLSWCLENDGILPGVYIPECGPNKRWTKRDCFVAMNCDTAVYWYHPQVQATFSIWQKNAKALAFVEEWLMWCQKPEVITDDPNRLGLANFEGFVAHRHDQSVLTNLVVKHQLKCFGSIVVPLPGAKDMNNAIDRALRREDRIAKRELRKHFQVWGSTTANLE
jgi:hypothetical protein